MISELVLSLAFIGGIRDHLDDEDFSSEAAQKNMANLEIHTKDDLEHVFDPQKLLGIFQILDVNQDGMIDVFELTVLEIEGAAVASFELSDHEALSLADGAVREDGELETDYVDIANFRSWFVDTMWHSLLKAADKDGDKEISPEEWADFSQLEAAILNDLDLHAPVDAEPVESELVEVVQRPDMTPPDNAVEALVGAGSVYNQVVQRTGSRRRRLVGELLMIGYGLASLLPWTAMGWGWTGVKTAALGLWWLLGR